MLKSKLSRTKSVSNAHWYWIIVWLSLFGLGVSIYLSFVHWSVHNLPGHTSSCAINQKINCDTVALSQYSSLAGVPISFWSSLFFVLMLSLALWGLIKKTESWPWSLMGMLNLVSLVASTSLFLISELIIQSFCIYCVCTYLLNLLIGITWIMGPQPSGIKKSKAFGFWLLGPNLGFAIFLILFSSRAFQSVFFWISWSVLLAGGISFLVGKSKTSILVLLIRAFQDLKMLFSPIGRAIVLSGLVTAGLFSVLVFIPRIYHDQGQAIASGIENIATGKTTEGHNWIGSSQPEVTIVEYSDYECPFCRKAHEVVRQVVRERKDWLRMVHIHVPLDHSCNPMVRKPFHLHSCACAKAAICADQQGRFWEMNDALFIRRCNLDIGGLAMLAQNLGLDLGPFRNCMSSTKTVQSLQSDIKKCMEVAKECSKMGRSFGTPMFEISGDVIMGFRKIDFWSKKAESARQAYSKRVKKSL